MHIGSIISQRNKQGLRNPWVLGLAGIMLSGVLINVYLVWRVFDTPVRLLDEVYSVKDHNKGDAKWVQQEAARNRLGWHAKLYSPQQSRSLAPSGAERGKRVLLANPAEFQLDLSDRDGQPVRGAQAIVKAQWPTSAVQDVSGKLYETVPGHYEGRLAFPRMGNWDLTISIDQEADRFVLEDKIVVAVPE